MSYTLGYKDRFIRQRNPLSLPVCDSLEPFPYLAQDQENKILLKLTGSQITELVSALKTGADLVYPEKSNDILWYVLGSLSCLPELEEETDNCINYPPYASFIGYFPQNPYTEPELIPDDYIVSPFFVNSDYDYPQDFGYLASDVFINPAALNIDPIDIATLNFPRLIITAQGSGQIEIDFLAVQNGGFCIIKIGAMPNLIDILQNYIFEDGIRIIDLNADPISLPQETDVIVAEEIDIIADVDTQTDIYCVFIPKLDDSFIPLQFGGGIRQVGLCGFEDNCNCEEGEIVMVTKAELIEGICEGMQCYTEEIAKRIVTGVTSGFSINENGEVILGDDTPVLENDPETPVNEILAAQCGAALYIETALEEIGATMWGWFGNDAVADIAEAVAQFRFRTKYDVDENLASIYVTVYWQMRTNSDPVIVNWNGLAEYLFCDGVTRQSIYAFIIDTFSPGIQGLAVYLIDCLHDSALDAWISKGQSLPSTIYLTYGCVPIPDFEFEFDMGLQNLMSVQTPTAWKKDHRYAIEISGMFSDSDNPDIFRDGMYEVNTLLNTVTWAPTGFNFGGGAVLANTPNSTNVPYKADHKYYFTMDKITVNATGTISRENGANMDLPNVSGVLHYKIVDLGEYV